MFRRIDRYLIQEILGPLALGFLVYTFLLLFQFLFKSAEMIIRRGLPVSVVGQLLAMTLPNIVVLTIPMAMLFGILIAVGRLSADSELTALRSSGVSLLTLYRPILLVSICLTALNMGLMLEALPWGNQGLQQLRFDIATQSVARQVQPRVFYEDWEGLVLYVFEVAPGNDRWHGVFLAESLPSTFENQVTVAKWGQVRVDEDGERVILELEDATTHKVNLREPESYEITHHERVEIVVEDSFLTEQREKMSVSKSLRELTLRELRDRLDSPSPEVRNLARVEIHKKFSIPIACIVFGLIALPLGFNTRRGGKGSGFAISIGVILVYYILISNGEEAARFSRIPPWVAMWFPNVLLATAGILLLVRRNRDKSLLLVRVDRWLRSDLWGFFSRWQRRLRGRVGRRQARRRRRARARNRSPFRMELPGVRLRFPNLLDRYVMKTFGRVFVLALLAGVSIYIIADLSENLDEILRNGVSRGVVFDYYKFLSMQIFFEVAPILVLVTTLITFSLLTRTNEVIATKALGVSLYRLALPALAMAALVVLLSLYLQSEVLPASNQRVAQLRDQIRGRETPRTYRRADRQWLFGNNRYMYNYLHFDPRSESLQRLQIFEFDDQYRLTRRLFTRRAEYLREDGSPATASSRGHDGPWIFRDGWVRSFDRSEPAFTEFKAIEVDYPVTPEYFDSEVLPPEQMRYGELKRYIQDLKESGQATPELEVQLYNKIAFPVVSMVMALVGLPFAFRLGRQGALYGIGVSVALGIVFMGVFAFFTTLGEAGALPPLVAVWSPGLVFALLSVYLFLGVRT
jgi:LPS export ABC transporter permease LptF/LPS export ABC transporter permease LptG